MVTRTKDWQQQTHRRAAIVFDQLAAAVRSAPDPQAADEFMAAPGNPYWSMLDRLYGEDYALARLLDSSDLVVHAEGPAASDPAPQLRAVNWLCTGVETNLRSLAKAVLVLAGREVDKLVKQLDFRLTGFAPGSLYAGFALAPSSDADLIDSGDDVDEPVFRTVRDAIRNLGTSDQRVEGADGRA